MKVPVEWLREYVDFDADASELAERLTFAGQEVESIDTVESEAVLDIKVTPNRPDCLGMIGIARETAALFGSRLMFPAAELDEGCVGVETLTNVEIEDAVKCPRYTARVIDNVSVGPSPDWIRKRLAQCGMNSISNVVDVTNYVLLECGHPLHAFDMSRLAGERIVVRRAGSGEEMVTLDGVSRVLTPDMLVIADAGRPVALAGIMGGLESEICRESRTLLLESAYFESTGIRATCKALKMETESSARFERGADIGILDWASRRAASLIAQLAGGNVARGCIDVCAAQRRQASVPCRFDRVRRLIGTDIGDDDICAIMSSLELTVRDRSDNDCHVEIPSFRVDLKRETDLIEEVARIHGLDKVPDDSPRAVPVPGMDDSGLRGVFVCRSNLAALGLAEILNYSLVSNDLLDLFESESDRRIALVNPSNREQGMLRTRLLPQMCETLGKNVSRQNHDAACFEIGRVFFRDGKGRNTEEERLCIGLTGKVGRVRLDRKRPVDPPEMFSWVKGIVECLFAAQHLGMPAFRGEETFRWSDGQANAILLGGECLGVIGLLSPDLRAKWRLAEPVGLVELALGPILKKVFCVPQFSEITPYPSISRDIAVVVEEKTTNGQIVRAIREKASRELTSIDLFDIFRNERVGMGMKSLAYTLTFRSADRTLTDEEANGFRDLIVEHLRNELNVEVRK